MRGAVNPFVEEGLRAYSSHAVILRTYVVLLALLGALLFFWWPRGPVAASLFPNAAPRTFTAVDNASAVVASAAMIVSLASLPAPLPVPVSMM